MTPGTSQPPGSGAQPGHQPLSPPTETLGILVVAAVGGATLTIVHSAPPTVAVVSIAVGLAIPLVAAATRVRRRPSTVTPADRITLLRIAFTGIIATGTVLVLAGVVPQRSWPVTVLVAATLASDALDGWVARRTGTASKAGARLDMEADAALLLVLTILAGPTTGWWVVTIGAMRYLFLAAGWRRPALRGPLPFSQFRRVTAALQGIALLIALTPTIPPTLGTAVAAGALALLLISFGRDVIRLERTRQDLEPTTRSNHSA